MTENILARLFEHNNWANLRMIEACSALSDAQLDAEPSSATKGTIRQTLIHLVRSQRGYLSLLTLPVDARPEESIAFNELRQSASISGEKLLTLARNSDGAALKAQLHTTDSWNVEPWVVMLQVINHATEHREQLNSMLSALGITPLELDGWSYGEVTNALTPTKT